MLNNGTPVKLYDQQKQCQETQIIETCSDSILYVTKPMCASIYFIVIPKLHWNIIYIIIHIYKPIPETIRLFYWGTL